MAFELDASGLATETREEIRARLLARLQGKFGNTLNVNTMESISSEWGETQAELLSMYQQIVLRLVQSFDPNSATGVHLDQRAALTGSTRKPARASTVQGVLTATGPCVVADGTTFRNDVHGTTWETYGGPYNFAGAGSQAATVRAIETGPKVAQAGDTWTPLVSIANLTSFTNPVEDADLGEDAESDPAFRRRRLRELYARGVGPLAAIDGVVSQLAAVRSVRTYHNPATSPVDADGIPWKATNTVVDLYVSPPSSEVKQQIWDAIMSATGAGGWAWASDDGYTGTSTDIEGNVHPMGFDVVAELDVWLTIEVETGGDGPVVPVDPTAMAELIRDSCVTEAQTAHTNPGEDFRALTYSGVVTSLVKAGELAGLSSLVVKVGTTVSPTSTSYVSVGIRQKINLDTSRCEVLINGTAY